MLLFGVLARLVLEDALDYAFDLERAAASCFERMEKLKNESAAAENSFG